MPMNNPSAVLGAWNKQSVQTGPLSRIRDLALRRIVWWGDSTVESASGNGNIPAAYASYYAFESIPGITLNKNFGGSGVSSATVLNTTPLVNIHNNNFTPAGVAAECLTYSVDLLVYGFALNDFRLDTNVATYGSAAWKTAILAMQANAVEGIRRVRLVVPSIPVLWMVPNTVCQTSLFIVGLGGQAVTDACRAAYLGDARYGVSALSDLVSNSQVCDAGGATFGMKSWPLVEYPTHINYNAGNDGLHPSTQGYLLRSMYIAEWLASGCQVDDFTTIATGIVNDSQTTYMDLQFNSRHAWLFGNTSGTGYGTTTEPGVAIGDYLQFVGADGARKNLRISSAPYQNVAEYYLRWANGNGPDGTFRTDVATGSGVLLRRRAIATPFDAMASHGGYAVYPIRVTAGGNGTCTVRGAAWATNRLSSRAPTTADFLCHPAIGGPLGGDGPMGLSLSGATILTTGTSGEYTIAKAGTYFATAVGQVGSIVAYA